MMAKGFSMMKKGAREATKLAAKAEERLTGETKYSQMVLAKLPKSDFDKYVFLTQKVEDFAVMVFNGNADAQSEDGAGFSKQNFV